MPEQNRDQKNLFQRFREMPRALKAALLSLVTVASFSFGNIFSNPANAAPTAQQLAAARQDVATLVNKDHKAPGIESAINVNPNLPTIEAEAIKAFDAWFKANNPTAFDAGGTIKKDSQGVYNKLKKQFEVAISSAKTPENFAQLTFSYFEDYATSLAPNLVSPEGIQIAKQVSQKVNDVATIATAPSPVVLSPSPSTLPSVTASPSRSTAPSTESQSNSRRTQLERGAKKFLQKTIFQGSLDIKSDTTVSLGIKDGDLIAFANVDDIYPKVDAQINKGTYSSPAELKANLYRLLQNENPGVDANLITSVLDKTNLGSVVEANFGIIKSDDAFIAISTEVGLAQDNINAAQAGYQRGVEFAKANPDAQPDDFFKYFKKVLGLTTILATILVSLLIWKGIIKVTKVGKKFKAELDLNHPSISGLSAIMSQKVKKIEGEVEVPKNREKDSPVYGLNINFLEDRPNLKAVYAQQESQNLFKTLIDKISPINAKANQIIEKINVANVLSVKQIALAELINGLDKMNAEKKRKVLNLVIEKLNKLDMALFDSGDRAIIKVITLNEKNFKYKNGENKKIEINLTDDTPKFTLFTIKSKEEVKQAEKVDQNKEPSAEPVASPIVPPPVIQIEELNAETTIGAEEVIIEPVEVEPAKPVALDEPVIATPPTDAAEPAL